MQKIRHIFFDLDGTLWDFAANSKETQKEIFVKYQLGLFCSDFDTYERSYHVMNDLLWEDYRNDLISKEKLRWYRFFLTLKEFGEENEELARKLDQYYITESPLKTKLIPGTPINLVSKYKLHILTNGFTEVQYLKLEQSKLSNYFETITTSEQAGALKPHPEIFNFALNKAGATARESMMIGDSWEIDILGAKKAGMKYLYFNRGDVSPVKDSHKSFTRLEELIKKL